MNGKAPDFFLVPMKLTAQFPPALGPFHSIIWSAYMVVLLIRGCLISTPHQRKFAQINEFICWEVARACLVVPVVVCLAGRAGMVSTSTSPEPIWSVRAKTDALGFFMRGQEVDGKSQQDRSKTVIQEGQRAQFSLNLGSNSD